ncbi:MAG: LytTR family DNA-binding domain-containing protein [Clostridia bacterium]|nr:LytTR family DNA-binding domain-containing protein [Clostridia bacterium]
MLVDDEQSGLETLAFLLKDYPDVEIAFMSTDPVAALEALGRTAIDALFLDIEMPVVSGVDFCERVKETRPEIAIVFTTAYEHYAVRAFELGALDYLLKPVTRAALRRTIDRLREYCGLLGRGPRLPVEDSEMVLGTMDGKHYVIDFTKALYLVMEQRSVFVVTPKGRFRLRNNNISYWENTLAPKGWFRSHRAYLINLKKIESISKMSNSVYYIRMKGGTEEIPVSRSFFAEFRQLLGM